MSSTESPLNRTQDKRQPGDGRRRGKQRRTGAGDGLRDDSIELYRALLASTLDALIVIDDHGLVLLASDSVERVFGYRSDELVGANIKVLMPEPHRSAHDGYLEAYRRTGKTNILNQTRPFVVLHKDGRRLDCELSVSRVERSTGEPLFIGSFRDVSDRVALERIARANERRLQVIFDRSFEYMGLLDLEGNLIEINQAALDATGIARADVLGRPLWETRWWSVGAAEREKLRAGIRRALKGEFVRFETKHLGREGEILAVDFSLSPVIDDDGEVTLLVPEGRDVTALKRAQAAETSMLRSLAAIGESAAILAHEIKNPITSVNLALRAVADKLGEDHRVVLGELVARMQRLERVMRRTLSFTRPVVPKSSECDGGELLRGVVHELRPAIDASGIRFELRVPPADLGLCADGQLVGEILTNLINNAIEAIRDGVGGRIHASVVGEADRLRFVVEDDGPGIPESQREIVFKPFHTTKSSGAGLGLAFCLKVAQAHGGRLSVERGPMGGARFELELPRQSRTASEES